MKYYLTFINMTPYYVKEYIDKYGDTLLSKDILISLSADGSEIEINKILMYVELIKNPNTKSISCRTIYNNQTVDFLIRKEDINKIIFYRNTGDKHIDNKDKASDNSEILTNDKHVDNKDKTLDNSEILTKIKKELSDDFDKHIDNMEKYHAEYMRGYKESYKVFSYKLHRIIKNKEL